jgi:hypothetical protein
MERGNIRAPIAAKIAGGKCAVDGIARNGGG